MPLLCLCFVFKLLRPNHVHSLFSISLLKHFIVCFFRIAHVYFALSLFRIMFVFLYRNRIVMNDPLCLIVTDLIV